MEKVIKIGGIDCRLKTSAAIPRLYRLKFNEDLIVDFGDLVEDVKKNDGTLSPEGITTLEQFCYICHKYGDPSQPDDILEWLEQFDSDTAIYSVLNDLIGLWNVENEQKSRAKKKKDEQ